MGYNGRVKKIRNATQGPLRVPLPQGKILHLGPNQSGEISHKDVDHPPFQKLVTAGQVVVEDSGDTGHVDHEHGKGPHSSTHGHHKPTGSLVKGDR